MPASTSIYLSIVAESHEEFVEKIAALYAGFCAQPIARKAALAAATAAHENFAESMSPLNRGACDGPGVDLDTSADLQLTLAGLHPMAKSFDDRVIETVDTKPVAGEGPKQARRRGRPRKIETQEAAAVAPPQQEAPAAVEQSPEETPEAVAATPASAPAAGDISDFLQRTNGTSPPGTAGLPEPAPATKEDVRTALNAYMGRTSMAEARALVQKVCGADVLSLSQIPEDKYAAMVAAATAG